MGDKDLRSQIEGLFSDLEEPMETEERSPMFLERAVEQSVDGIAVAGLDGNIQFVNPAWAQMHGYSVEELLGCPLSIFHTEQQLQEDVVFFNERVMEFGAHQGEVGHVRKDGTTFPTWMTTTVLKDEEGEPVGLVGTARDITERKQAEAAWKRLARETQVRFDVSQALAGAQTEDEVLDALTQQAGIYPEAQVVFSLYDSEAEEPTLVTRSGASFESGLAPAEIGSRFPASRFTLLKLLSPGTPLVVSNLLTDERLDPASRQYMTGLGNVSILAITMAMGDEPIGVLRAGSSEEGFFDEGKIHLYQALAEQGAVALQSARLRADVQKSEARFRGFAEAAEYGFGMADLEGNITYVNLALGRLFGEQKPEEAIGKNIASFYPEEVLEEVAGKILPAVLEEGQWVGELPLVSIEGKVIPTIQNIFLVRGEEGAPPSYANILTDITERKRLEEAQARFSRLHSQFSDLLTGLLSPGPLAAKLRQVTDWIVEYVDADFCRVWIIQEGDLCDECTHAQATVGDRHLCRHRDRCLHLKASSGRYTHIDGEVHRRVPFGAYKIGRVAAGDESSFLTNDAQNDPRIHNLEWTRELGLVSFAGYKLSTPEGEVLGVFALFSQQVITPEEDAFLESVASATSLVIRASALEEEGARLAEAREVELRRIARRRADEVQVSTEVAQEIAAAPALDELYRRVVTLVKERFGYYHAQIFRHDPERDAMVVVEGYGRAGEKMKAAGHNLPYGRGVVGTAAATGSPVLASDVAQDPHWVPHPDLPETKGELAVPIKLRRMENGEWRDEVLGVLDVQSDTAGTLSEEDQVMLLGLAGQIAIAIESTRLFERTRAALEEAEATHRRYLSEQWAEVMAAQVVPYYERTQPGVVPLGDAVPPEIERAVVQQEVVVRSSTGDGAEQAALVAPINLRGTVIGALGLQETEGGRQWTEDEIALIEAVADQMALALENARLFEQTQRRAARERLIREITARIRGSVDVGSIMQTTVQEVSKALGASHGLVRLGTEVELLGSEDEKEKS